MEACLESKEPTSVEIKSVEVHEEVPKEEATVKTVRALKERYGDRHLAIGCCRQLKKQTQGNGGFWKKLATTHRWLSRCPLFLHGVRDTLMRDQAGTVLQEEPLKDGRLRGDNGRTRKATVE
jgi:hypothetical protein